MRLHIANEKKELKVPIITDLDMIVVKIPMLTYQVMKENDANIFVNPSRGPSIVRK